MIISYIFMEDYVMMNILIVDDEKPILNLIRISLSNAGYLCDTAADGNQALEKNR